MKWITFWIDILLINFSQSLRPRGVVKFTITISLAYFMIHGYFRDVSHDYTGHQEHADLNLHVTI